MSLLPDVYVDAKCETSELLQKFLQEHTLKYNFIFRDFDPESEHSFLTFTNNRIGFLKGNQKLVCVDFTDERLLKRFAATSVKDLFIKAVYPKAKSPVTLCDMTAGFGVDALMASKYFQKVILVEENPLIHLMLEDGLRRALKHDKAKRFALKVMLIKGTASEVIQSWILNEKPEAPVLYFDFMFEDKKTLSSKSLETLREIILKENSDSKELETDSSDILKLALKLNPMRVVLKSKHAPQDISIAKSWNGKVVNYYSF